MDDGQCLFVDLIDDNVVLCVNIGLYLGMGIGDVEMGKKGGIMNAGMRAEPHTTDRPAQTENGDGTPPPEISRKQCFPPLKEFPLNGREPSPHSLSLPTAEGWFTLKLGLAI